MTNDRSNLLRHAPSSPSPNPALPFGLGFFSLVAQTVLFREFLVVFEGNELSAACFFSGWLIWVSFGALLGRVLSKLERRVRTENVPGLTLIYLPVLIIQYHGIRFARLFAGVERFEIFPLDRMIVTARLHRARFVAHRYPFCSRLSLDKPIPKRLAGGTDLHRGDFRCLCGWRCRNSSAYLRCFVGNLDSSQLCGPLFLGRHGNKDSNSLNADLSSLYWTTRGYLRCGSGVRRRRPVECIQSPFPVATASPRRTI